MPTPTEVADALVAVLQKAAAPMTPEATSNMLEYAFGHITLVQQMQEAQRIACFWHVTELGGVPLLVAGLQPDSPVMTLAMTITGIMFKDENLLAHKMGRMFLNNERFLQAIHGGLKATGDEMMPFLVSQVLHNILRTASSKHIQEVAEYDALVPTLEQLTRQSARTLDTTDWRLLFVLVDTLLLLETGNAGKRLDELGVSKLPLDLLLAPEHTALFKEREALLSRTLSWIFLWAMRQRHSKKEEYVALRTAIYEAVPTIKTLIPEEELARDPATMTPNEAHAASLGNLYHSLERLSQGDETYGLPIHLTIKSRVRNWAQIEKDAEGKVRSPDFKRQFDEQKKAAEARLAGDTGEKKEKPRLDVSSDESSDDEDEDKEKEDKPAAGGEAAQEDTTAAAAAGSAEPATETSSTTTSTAKEPLTEAGAPAPGTATATATPASASVTVPQDVLDQVTRLKNEGNTYFRGEEYGDAAEVYGEALEALQSATGSAKADEARILGNRAECFLKLGKPEDAVADCDRALALDPAFVKGYHRRARANQALGKKEAAIADLRALLNLDEKNTAAMTLLKDLQAS